MNAGYRQSIAARIRRLRARNAALEAAFNELCGAVHQLAEGYRRHPVPDKAWRLPDGYRSDEQRLEDERREALTI